MNVSHITFAVLLLLIVVWSWQSKKLTPLALCTAAIVATIIFLGTGWNGIVSLGIFFILSIIATQWHRNKKQYLTGENDSSTRTAGQVIANGGVAAILGISAIIFPVYEFWCKLGIAACFSSALADTLSSELGMVYGKKFYNILSLKEDQRGENGVISIEGIIIGIVGSALIAFLFGVLEKTQFYFFPILIAGTIGNFTDSILGATLERKNKISNNGVNFLNTLIAALVMFLFVFIFYR